LIDVGISPHAAEHHSQHPWRCDFTTCCRPTFQFTGRRSSWVSR